MRLIATCQPAKICPPTHRIRSNPKSDRIGCQKQKKCEMVFFQFTHESQMMQRRKEKRSAVGCHSHTRIDNYTHSQAGTLGPGCRFATMSEKEKPHPNLEKD